jgi:glyoxylase-like metal-dependent hydrolase (beta-lactamase superfamily II)
VLVNPGLSVEDVRRRRLFRSRLREEDTALRQLQRRGFSPADVRDIIVSHLDLDHAGGVDDFPRARVHVLETEVPSAETHGWSVTRRFVRYIPRGERWLGFEAVRPLWGLPPEIALVPLPGHTAGHVGVAVEHGDRWLLHAGDAYVSRGVIDATRPRGTARLRATAWWMATDRHRWLESQRRLRELAASQPHFVQVFSSHDAGGLEETDDAAPSSRAS